MHTIPLDCAEQLEEADALHALGLIASESDQQAEAAMLVRAAIRIAGPLPAYCSNLGTILIRQGRPAEAIACYRQALETDPENPAVFARLGLCWLEQGESGRAIEALRASLDFSERQAGLEDPILAEAHFALGNALYERRQFEEAATAYRSSIRRRGAHPESHYNLGVICTIRGAVAEAMACYEDALALRPHYPEAHNNLGILLQSRGDAPGALAHYRLALEQNPQMAEARYNHAFLLQECNAPHQAYIEYRQLLRSHPAHLEARNNLANVLLSLARPAEALQELDKLLAAAPNSPEARWNRGIAQLTLGNYREGWAGYEWRFAQPHSVAPLFASPRWDGAPLNGSRLLIHAEQGLGDTLQFIRFAAHPRVQAGHVTLECPSPLIRLLSRMPGLDAIVPRGEPTPEVDHHIPLLSLAHTLEIGQASLADSRPYLTADTKLVKAWREHIDECAPRATKRVGLCWAGNPRHRNDRNRSLSAPLLDDLAKVPGVAYFCLHPNPPELPDLQFSPWLAPLDDFDVTAACIANLDLVITVDTAIAHLAGGMGRPVWVLLPFAADWRWMLDRDDSPWYPSARLFRQPSPNDWESVVDAVCQALGDR